MLRTAIGLVQNGYGGAVWCQTVAMQCSFLLRELSIIIMVLYGSTPPPSLNLADTGRTLYAF